MANPYVNKVVYGGNTLVDLTEDDVTANDVLLGKSFHLASGARGTGTLDPMNKVSNPTANDILVTDASGQAIDSGVTVQELKALVIESGSFSSLPQTLSNANITADHIVMESILSNPSAQTSDWTVTTSAGSLTISGSISGTTTITLYLLKKQ